MIVALRESVCTATTWETVKTTSSSRMSKLTILVPFIGWLILYNNEFLRFIYEALDIENTPNFTWRVHMFYVGLFLIGLSTIIYSLRCPEIISEHHGYSDYAKRVKEYATPDFCNALCKEYNIPEINFNELLPADSNREAPTKAELLHFCEIPVNDALRKVYDTEKYNRPKSMYTSLFFFTAGSILVLIPSVLTVSWSANEIFDQFF